MAKQKRLKLIKARKNAGLKQQQLAPLIEKTQGWLSLVEQGKFKVFQKDRLRIAKALKVDLKTLGFGA